MRHKAQTAIKAVSNPLVHFLPKKCLKLKKEIILMQ